MGHMPTRALGAKSTQYYECTMFDQSLAQTVEMVAREYAGHRSVVARVNNMTLTDGGHLRSGDDTYSLTHSGEEQLARILDMPARFYARLDGDLRSAYFGRHFVSRINVLGLPPELRIHIDGRHRIVGFDDPGLLRISPLRLMDVVNDTLPEGLSAEQIRVAVFGASADRFHISLVSPDMRREPRVGDVINGGIDVLHHSAGDRGTQVHCYLRRLVCANGAIIHVCNGRTKIRARRLPNGRFNEQDMLRQVGRVLSQAWGQVEEKLAATMSLLGERAISMEFLRQQRVRFSLSNRTLEAIEQALNADELEATNSQLDWFNAISRVASHHTPLSFRQRRILGRIAGELSQVRVDRCSECGRWFVRDS